MGKIKLFSTDLEVPSYKPFSPGVVIVAFETSIVSLVTPSLTRPNAFWKTLLQHQYLDLQYKLTV